MKRAVLLVEDDIDLGHLLKQYLELNGFSVVLCVNGIDAKKHLRQDTFDIVLTDILMPLEDGFDLAGYLRSAYPRLPFLFVTACNLKEDVVKGLELGADDYIFKPFDAEVLVLRIRNILNRVSNAYTSAEAQPIGLYILDSKNLVLEGFGIKQYLTEREAALLRMLADNMNQLVRKEDILNRLWKESDFFTSRSMAVFVSRLRKYLSHDPGIVIENIRGIGLRLLVK